MGSMDGTGDVARPPGEDAWFRARVSELEGAIRRVVTQEADDLCWMDVYTQLAALVGIAFDPRMIPRDRMLANCERFVDSLIGGCPYAVDATTAELARLRARVAELEAERDRRPPAGKFAGPVPFTPEGRAEWVRVLEACRAAWAEDPDDEPDPATLARAAGLDGGFDETAPDPALAGWADDDWEAGNR